MKNIIFSCTVFMTFGAYSTSEGQRIVSDTRDIITNGSIMAIEILSNDTNVTWNLLYKRDKTFKNQPTFLDNKHQMIDTTVIDRELSLKFGIPAFHNMENLFNQDLDLMPTIRFKDLFSKRIIRSDQLSDELTRNLRVGKMICFSAFRSYDVISFNLDLSALSDLSSKAKLEIAFFMREIFSNSSLKKSGGVKTPIFEVNSVTRSINLYLLETNLNNDINKISIDDRNYLSLEMNDIISEYNKKAKRLSLSEQFSFNERDAVQENEGNSFSAFMNKAGNRENKAIEYHIKDDGSLDFILSHNSINKNLNLGGLVHTARFVGIRYRDIELISMGTLHYRVGAFGTDIASSESVQVKEESMGFNLGFHW